MMKKFFLLIEVGSFFIALVLLLNSCNRNDAAPVKADEQNTTKKTAMKDAGKDAKLLSGNLDTLWINAPTFVALNPKLTFRFYDTINVFTLHGWLGNSNSYNNRPPDVRLSIGRKSDVQFGSGSYFGNLVLNAQSLNKIQKLVAANHSAYILFAPQDPATNNGQVIYKIFLTNDDPGISTLVTINMIPTDEFTNPSPPRNE
jgi:hypothetical protein